LAKERFALEVAKRVLGVSRTFKLDKAKASHDTAVNNTTKPVKELIDIFRASVWGKTTEIETTGHVDCVKGREKEWCL
jgi:LmbE family N-acetylglucosaminyl deacetylase